jgi:hypothetical protein
MVFSMGYHGSWGAGQAGSAGKLEVCIRKAKGKMMKFRPRGYSRFVALIFTALAFPAMAQDGAVPRYKVDPAWPRRLPNNWIMGEIAGMATDSKDHVWVLQRPRSATADELYADAKPPMGICCSATPAVMEFDSAGRLLRSWGGPKFMKNWPKHEHGLTVDGAGNVWLAGNGKGDRSIFKFSGGGKLLMEIGHPSEAPRNNQDTSILGQVADMQVDDAANELYVADGYLNTRIVVFDSNTGRFKRGWGAFGEPLSAIPNTGIPEAYVAGMKVSRHFSNPVHCVKLSRDGLVYVCDETNTRIQVFTRQGKFVKEFPLRVARGITGSPWMLSLSADPGQKHLLIADGRNNIVQILRRTDGVEAGRFGHAGRMAGDFQWVHQAAIDSKGNYYTGESTGGKRIQKFVLINSGQ